MNNTDLRTITLEILRPGPPHNQLLSPLTQYLALCDNRGAVTLAMPFEHREMLRQREALSYRVPRDQREAQLMQTASEVGDKVLGAISTLNAAMAHTQYGGSTLVHLRLILSASELALLPFELAIAPKGFPGEAKPLLLQSIAPVTITREVRSATVSVESFARQPRILVAAASPPGFEPVPLRAHMLALRRAIAAWLPDESDENVRRMITVLPRASVQDLREACARQDYTHVHILGHGTQYSEAGEGQFGLALFDSSGAKTDVVSGSRLVHALRTHREDGAGFSNPNFVTLCTCDSGKLGSVVFPGASLAHELHEAGLPWVIASQFPLSMAGSTLLTEMLYTGLLRGEDPRIVLHHVRQCLRAQFSDTHDWASLVTYAAVPPDFAEQVRELRQLQAHRAIDAGFARADGLLVECRAALAVGRRADAERLGAQIDKVLTHVDHCLARLDRASPREGGPVARGRQVHTMARQGAVEKRRAYVLFHRSGGQGSAWREAARRARAYYYRAAKIELNKHWPLTQYLSLFALLGEAIPQDYWSVARIAAELDLEAEETSRRAWAVASLIELRLLEQLFRPKSGGVDRAVQHCAELSRMVDTSSFVIESTRRQIERYLDWGQPAQDERFVASVRRVVAALGQQVLAPSLNEEEGEVHELDLGG